MRLLEIIALSVMASGCDSGRTPGSGPDGGGDLRGAADLAQGSAADFAGINCLGSTCLVGPQLCCLNDNDMGGFYGACSSSGSCPTGSTSLACDGPEDCPGTSAPNGGCCIGINGTGDADAGARSGQGASSCGGSCPGRATVDNAGNYSAMTKLCHTKADCAGYSGTITITSPQTVGFDACCTQPQAGPYTFCAPAIADGLYGIRCPPVIN